MMSLKQNRHHLGAIPHYSNFKIGEVLGLYFYISVTLVLAFALDGSLYSFMEKVL